MCILLKLDYVKFGVSNLFFSKVIKEKPLRGSARHPTGRVDANISPICYQRFYLCVCNGRTSIDLDKID